MRRHCAVFDRCCVYDRSVLVFPRDRVGSLCRRVRCGVFRITGYRDNRGSPAGECVGEFIGLRFGRGLAVVGRGRAVCHLFGLQRIAVAIDPCDSVLFGYISGISVSFIAEGDRGSIYYLISSGRINAYVRGYFLSIVITRASECCRRRAIIACPRPSRFTVGMSCSDYRSRFGLMTS